MKRIVRGWDWYNPWIKKPCIVIALHNTLFFHRGLFKGRSHLKFSCIYLSVLNNLISKSFVPEVHQPGFANTFTGYIVAAILGKVIFSITLSCFNNKLPGWRVKNESSIFKISSIFICQRYAIDGLFYEFDICFVVFTETFLVLYFFRPLLQQQSRLFSSREFLLFLNNPKMI